MHTGMFIEVNEWKKIETFLEFYVIRGFSYIAIATFCEKFIILTHNCSYVC